MRQVQTQKLLEALSRGGPAARCHMQAVAGTLVRERTSSRAAKDRV